MKRVHKLVLVGTTAAGILLVVGISTLAYLFSSICGNHPVAEFVSPDAVVKVVVFQRDCGATTGFSTQASLLKLDVQPPSASSGNLFIAATDHGIAPSGPGGGPELRVRWEGPKHILLQHHVKARVFKAEHHLDGIEVRYETFPGTSRITLGLRQTRRTAPFTHRVSQQNEIVVDFPEWRKARCQCLNP